MFIRSNYIYDTYQIFPRADLFQVLWNNNKQIAESVKLVEKLGKKWNLEFLHTLAVFVYIADD